MKKLIYLISAMILLTSSHYVSGAIGCMDNSYHLKEKYDSKQYHYVQCNCPCHKYVSSFNRGICPECGHYHDPGEFTILSRVKLEKKTKKAPKLLKELIAKRKREKRAHLR